LLLIYSASRFQWNVSQGVQCAFEILGTLQGMFKVAFKNVDGNFAKKLVRVMFDRLPGFRRVD